MAAHRPASPSSSAGPVRVQYLWIIGNSPRPCRTDPDRTSAQPIPVSNRTAGPGSRQDLRRAIPPAPNRVLAGPSTIGVCRFTGNGYVDGTGDTHDSATGIIFDTTKFVAGKQTGSVDKPQWTWIITDKQ